MEETIKENEKKEKEIEEKEQKFRYERKFIVELDAEEIEYLIKHHPFMFSEIFYKRNVNNIYLDSVDLQNYKENLAGDSERVKIRVGNK